MLPKGHARVRALAKPLPDNLRLYWPMLCKIPKSSRCVGCASSMADYTCSLTSPSPIQAKRLTQRWQSKLIFKKTGNVMTKPTTWQPTLRRGSTSFLQCVTSIWAGFEPHPATRTWSRKSPRRQIFLICQEKRAPGLSLNSRLFQ